MANTDGADAGRTNTQPTPASAAGAESKHSETLPQGAVGCLGPKQGLPPVFGRYRVQKYLGGGGMGAVYLVVNTELEREEALKVPHFDAADDPAVRERFLREAKAAARLDHPNLCPVYDVGVLDGVYYLTMRYLKGKLLSEYSGTAQPPRKAVEIVTKLAQALAGAHAKGVIHRDLKPTNIMMCAGVGPVVMDFGLAKQTGRQDRTLTQLGTTLGTPAYMPPEQVKGELDRMGPASDVYSLGVILFELLTGRLPFEGGTTAEVYGKILYIEAPVPSALRPGLPAALDAICAKATAKAPEGRYASMKEFAAALIEYLKAAPSAEEAGNLTAAKTGPADIFQMETVAPKRVKATPPLRRSKILAVATQIGARVPSPVRKSDSAHQGNLRATVVAGADEERSGRSSGTIFVWAVCGALILGGLVGIGALVCVINQRKAAPPSALASAIPASPGAAGIADVVKPPDRMPPVAHPLDPTPPDSPPVAKPPDATPSPGDIIMTKEAFYARFPLKHSIEASPDEIIANSIGMKLKLIKAGAFKMGSSDSDKNAPDEEKPQHTVEITHPFYLGVCPVAKGQFASFVSGTDYKTEAEQAGDKETWRDPGFVQTDDDPVVYVSWNDAVQFCEWLSRKEKKSYGLPTEAQWEYACRAGTTTAFSFGDDPQMLGDYAWYGGNSGKRTHPVGGKKANPWGLYDMNGNVWQWCDDYYDPEYYQNSPNKDPKNVLNWRAGARVLRGGSWFYGPGLCLSAYRYWLEPGIRGDHVGCRVALCVN